MLKWYSETFFKIEAWLHSQSNPWWVVFVVNALLFGLLTGVSYFVTRQFFGPGWVTILVSATLSFGVSCALNPRCWDWSGK